MLRRLRHALRRALLSFILGVREDRRDQEQHLAVLWIATTLDHLRADIVAISLHPFDTLHMRDHGIRMPRREPPSPRRAPGLGYHRAALRQRPRVQRPATTIICAFEIDRVDLGGIDQNAGFAIRD